MRPDCGRILIKKNSIGVDTVLFLQGLKNTCVLQEQGLRNNKFRTVSVYFVTFVDFGEC